MPWYVHIGGWKPGRVGYDAAFTVATADAIATSSNVTSTAFAVTTATTANSAATAGQLQSAYADWVLICHKI